MPGPNDIIENVEQIHAPQVVNQNVNQNVNEQANQANQNVQGNQNQQANQAMQNVNQQANQANQNVQGNQNQQVNQANQEAFEFEKLKVDEKRRMSVDATRFKKKMENEFKNHKVTYAVPENLSEIKRFVDQILSDTESAGEEFTALKEAAARFSEVVTYNQCQDREFNYYGELMALYAASDRYYYSHNGFKWTTKGRRRRDLTNNLSTRIAGLVKDNMVIQGIIVDEYKKNGLDKTEDGKNLLKGLAVLNTTKKIEAEPDRQQELQLVDKVSDVTEKLMTYTNRKNLCVKAIEKATNISISRVGIQTGMDSSAIKAMLPTFKINSDGTPATAEDAALMQKGIDMVQAFYGDDTAKRNKYLDEVLDKCLKLSTDPKEYLPSKLEGNVEKYCEISNIVSVFTNIFDKDTYNRAYLDNAPGMAKKQARDKNNAVATFGNMISKLYNSVYSYDIKSDTVRLFQSDIDVEDNIDELYTHICGKNSSVDFLNTEGGNTQRLIKKLMGNYTVIDKDTLIQSVDNALETGEITAEEQQSVMGYINESGKNTFVLDNTKAGQLKEFENDYNREDTKTIFKKTRDNEVIDDIYFERALEELYVTDDQSGINKDALKVLENYVLERFGNTHNIVNDKKALDAICIGMANYVVKSNYYSSYGRINDILVNYGYSGDADRVVGAFYRKVRYNKNHEPLSDIDKKNDERNKTIFEAFADNNKEKIYAYVMEVIDEYMTISVNKDTLSPEHFFDDLEQKYYIADLDLRIDNIFERVKGFKEDFMKNDNNKYQSFIKHRDYISEYAHHFQGVLKVRYHIHPDKFRADMFGPYLKAEMPLRYVELNVTKEGLLKNDYKNVFTEEEKQAFNHKKERAALEEKYQSNKEKPHNNEEGVEPSPIDKIIYNQGSKNEEKDAEELVAVLQEFEEEGFYRKPSMEEISEAISGDAKKAAAYVILLEGLATANSDYDGVGKEIDYSAIADNFKVKLFNSREKATRDKIQYYIHAFKNAGEKIYLNKVDDDLTQDDLAFAEPKFVSQMAVKYHDTNLGVLLRAAKKSEEDLIKLSENDVEFKNALKTAEKLGMNYHAEKLDTVLYSEEKYKAHKENIKNSRYSKVLAESRKRHDMRAKVIGLKTFTPGDFVVYEMDGAEREVHLEAQRKVNELENDRANMNDVEFAHELLLINEKVNRAKYNIRKNERINVANWKKLYHKDENDDVRYRIDLNRDNDGQYKNWQVDKNILANRNAIAAELSAIDGGISAIGDGELEQAYSDFKRDAVKLQKGLEAPDTNWGGIDDEGLAFRFERSYYALLNNVKRVKKSQGRNVSEALTRLDNHLNNEFTGYYCQIALLGQQYDDIIYGQMSEMQDKRVDSIEKKAGKYKEGDRYKTVNTQDIDKVFEKGDIDEIVALGLTINELVMIEEIVSVDRNVFVGQNGDNEKKVLFKHFIDKMNDLHLPEKMEIFFGITGIINKYAQKCGQEILKNLGDKSYDKASKKEKRLAGEVLWFTENGIRYRAAVDLMGKNNPIINSTAFEAVLHGKKIGGESEYNEYIKDNFSESYKEANKFLTTKLTGKEKKEKLEPLKYNIYKLYNKHHMGFEYEEMEIGVNDNYIFESQLIPASPEQIIRLKNAAVLSYEQLTYGTKKRRVLNKKAFKSSRQDREDNQILRDIEGNFIDIYDLPNSVFNYIIDDVAKRLLNVKISEELKLVMNDFMGYIGRIKNNMSGVYGITNSQADAGEVERLLIAKDTWEDEMAVKMLEKRDAFVKALKREAERIQDPDARSIINNIRINMRDGSYGSKLELIAPMIQKICDRVYNAGSKKDMEEAKKTDKYIQKYIINDRVTIPDDAEIQRISETGTVRERVAIMVALRFAGNAYHDASLYGNIEGAGDAFNRFNERYGNIWENMADHMSAEDILEYESQLSYLEKYYMKDIEKDYKRLNGQPENAMLDAEINEELRVENAFSATSAKRSAVKATIIMDLTRTTYYIDIEKLARFHGYDSSKEFKLAFADSEYRDSIMNRLRNRDAVIGRIRQKVVDRCNHIVIPFDNDNMLVDRVDN